uniref:Threonine aldolase 1 n=1 Tax=Cyclopterus lumpus TaxID=8103 RepID=A0A8C3AUE8_CYCLU
MSLKTFSSRVLFKVVLSRGLVAWSKPLGPRDAAAAAVGCSSVRGYHNLKKPTYRGPGRAAHIRVVDLRSDAMSQPGPAMRQAMAKAKLTLFFKMEAALFVPSGSMGNLIAVMVHCRERGDEMIVGDLCHMHIYEQGGSAQIAGVHSTTVTTLPDGSFDLEELESKLVHNYLDPYYPRTRLICLENTHNIRGGRVLPLTFLQEVRALADRYGLSVHMDGARVMNAAVAQRVAPSTILQHTHTVSLCLSKGLGAPVGTVLAGPRDFISKAVRCRKALGGGMRQVGILAAAGKVALLEMVERLEEDHRNAKTFAQALLDCDPPLFAVDMAAVETNIVRFHLQPSFSPSEFCDRMGQVGEGEEAALGQGIQVLMFPYFGNSVRAVWHLGISPEDTQLAIRKMQFVASQFMEEKVRAQ